MQHPQRASRTKYNLLEGETGGRQKFAAAAKLARVPDCKAPGLGGICAARQQRSIERGRGSKKEEKHVIRTLKSFAVERRGLRGLAPAMLAPLYLMLFLCAFALGQEHAIGTVAGNPLAKSAGLTHTDVATAGGATLTLAGSLAQIASGGGWDTSLTLVNLGTSAGQANLSFYANNGSALPLPYTFPQQPALGTATGSSVNESINANAMLVLDTTGPIKQAAATGLSQLLTSGNIGGFGIFTYTPSGQAAVVPLEIRNAFSYLLAFDNTGGHLATGLAIANLASSPASVGVVIRDDTGANIGTGTINLAAQGHNSFLLTDSTLGFPITAGKRGTVEFETPEGGQISVLGLRANGNALTSLPVLANVGTAGGTMAHVASGGGWQTLFTLVNTGATSANVTLSFSADDGTALSLPLSFPQTGTTATESSVTQTIPAGATLLIATQGLSSASAVTGSAQLSTTGSVSGFAIFQSGGQEAVVPLQAGTASSYTLAFDNTGNLVTGVALANSSGQPAAVPATLRDSTGATLATTTVDLPASGHSSKILTDLFSQAANIRGTLEFDTPAGGQIGALGIRATGTAFTTIPVMTTAVTGDVVAERELAQTGLAVGLASTVLQSQLAIIDTTLTDDLSCVALSGGGSVLASPSKGTVTVYYGTDCTQPYLIVTNATGSLGTSGGAQLNIIETATYYGLSGTNIGTLSLNETALINGGAIDVYGLGAFTPASGAQTPVQLGLYCEFASATATTALCAGGVAQDFPELGLAIGAVTPLTVTLSSPPPILQLGAASTGGVTFTGGGTAFTGPIGSLTLTNPEPAALNLTGGTRYAFTTASGSAAAFSLFPPTPTSWTLIDSAHDQQLQISVVSNTTRNLTLTITQTSTGATLATGALDHSGSGTITYSDGTVAAITNWTLAD
jgi:hypothetical protein